MLKRLWKTASMEKVLGCDLRSLALLRIAIAVVLLADWCNRIKNFSAFHSEWGLFPRRALNELYANPYIWSLNNVAPGDWWQATLLALNFVCILALLFGWRTRLATFLCWVLQLSLQAKNPILMQSGDVLLRNILFWGMFLPWSGTYSVDAALSDTKRPLRIFTYSTVGVCLQALYVYFFGVFLKNGAQWRVDGTAVYYALSLDHFSTPLGKWLLTLPIDVLKAFNFSVLGFELVAPILLLLPWGHAWIRPILLLGFWSMHIGFGATLAIGNFVLISIASTIPFIPTETWDWLKGRLSVKTEAKAYYDEDCGICIKLVAVVKEFLFLPDSFFKPAQSDSKIEKIMLKEDSWVFVNAEGAVFVRSYALRELLRNSPLLFPLAWLFQIPGIHFLGDIIYRKIAANRGNTCNPNNPPLNSPSPIFQLNSFENYFLAFIVVFVAMWNVGTMPGSRFYVAQRLEPLALLLRIEQRWDMFAPFPLTEDGWFIIKSKLRDGREVDLFQDGQPITYAKPESVKDMYQDFRWRKYMVNLWSASYSAYRQYFSRYLCLKWNSEHSFSDHVMNLEIIYMKENTPPPGEALTEAVPTSIWLWNCSGEVKKQ